jgi:predicted ArsR family transcriptional regulator
MQDTRKHILDILKDRGQATVEDIVELLRQRFDQAITAVTVRHHLSVLQQQELISEPVLRHRSSPGRPQHIYRLSDKAQDIFPNNYRRLVSHLISEMREQLPGEGVNVIFEGVAVQMAADAGIPSLPLSERMDAIILYLNEQGYEASWETHTDGVLIHTRNCPYHHISNRDDTLCKMDFQLIAALVGAVPRRVGRMAEGDAYCAYLIPDVS